MSSRRLTAVLDGMGERSGSDWFGIADSRLEVSVDEFESVEDLLRAVTEKGSYSSAEVDALREVSGELGGCWVDVRVSGRIDGQEEMQEMVLRLLAEGGYGFDDRSDRRWSVDEIRDGLATGERFRA